MARTRINLLRLILLLTFTATVSQTIVAETSFVQSVWILSFDNIPRPLQVSIQQDLNQLPARWLTTWEKRLHAEESPSFINELKKQNEYQEARDQLEFNKTNYQRQQIYNLSYQKALSSFKPNEENNSPLWAKLAFHVENSPQLKGLNTKTGWLEFSSPTTKGEELLVISVTIHLENGTSVKKEFVFLAKQDTQLISSTIRDALASSLLNYSWLRLSFPVQPVDALFQIDSFTCASSDPKLLFFPADKLPVKLTLVKEGYKSKSFCINNSNDIPDKVVLESLESHSFTIDSSPRSANLYLNNLWLGQTPLTFQAVPQGSIISVVAEGFKPRYLPLNELKEKTFINLDSQNYWQGTQKLKKIRKRFYASLGTFILSFAPTALFASIDLNTTKLKEMGYTCNSVLTGSLFWGAVSFNISCLIWNIIESILYIRQAEKCARP